MPEEPSSRQRPCGKVWERLCSCRRFPCPLPSGTEGWAGRGLRESGVCGIKVIFARVAELVDALDLESSGLSIRVQVPSLAPEFARTSPAWLRDVFVLSDSPESAFPMPCQRNTGTSCVPAMSQAAVPLVIEPTISPSTVCDGSVLSSSRPLPGHSGRCRSRLRHGSGLPLPEPGGLPSPFPVSPKERFPS